MRGTLTPRIEQKARELLGIKLSKHGLRLMAYLDYELKNNQKLDPNKITPVERGILAEWREETFIEGGASGFSVTKHFYDAMQKLLWLAYVDY
jgi:hypothetical protein